MTNAARLIQIYQMTDATALASIVDVLSGTGRFKVDTRASDRGSFLIVEGDDPADALNVYELVVVADHATELIYSTAGRLEQSGSGAFEVNDWLVETQAASREPGAAGSNR